MVGAHYDSHSEDRRALEAAQRRFNEVKTDLIASLHNLHILMAQAAEEVRNILKHHHL